MTYGMGRIPARLDVRVWTTTSAVASGEDVAAARCAVLPLPFKFKSDCASKVPYCFGAVANRKLRIELRDVEGFLEA